jgi:phosphatidylinositol-3-phosphatase
MRADVRFTGTGVRIGMAGVSLVLLVMSAGCGSAQRLAGGASPGSSTAAARPAAGPVRTPARSHVPVSAATPTPKPTPKPRPAPKPRPQPKRPGHPHVMVLVEENHSLQQVIGNRHMPYLNGLARRYGLATHWNDLSHPSLPNYLGLISGSIQNNPQDTTPADRTYRGPTVVDQLAHAGYSWKAYMEDMPRRCDLTDTYSPGSYDVNHNPFAYFRSIRRNPAQCHRVVPFSEFARDLRYNRAPDFIWVTPNLIHDMHDGGYAQGDAFLRKQMSLVFASRWYRAGGTVIITFDEGETTEQVATLVISRHTRRGAHLTAAGNHYGTLRAIEKTYGLPLLGKAARASSGNLRRLF